MRPLANRRRAHAIRSRHSRSIISLLTRKSAANLAPRSAASSPNRKRPHFGRNFVPRSSDFLVVESAIFEHLVQTTRPFGCPPSLSCLAGFLELGLSDAHLQRRGERSTRVNTESQANRFGVMLCGPAADPEGSRDGGVRLPFGEPLRYLALTQR